MRISGTLAGFRINVSTTGGLRVGKQIGDTYISHKLAKGKRGKKAVAVASTTQEAAPGALGII